MKQDREDHHKILIVHLHICDTYTIQGLEILT